MPLNTDKPGRGLSTHVHACGFTLIELLVVIAVISVLMSILVPALHKVRFRAYEMSCLSNLRQINLALATYAGDDGRNPTNALIAFLTFLGKPAQALTTSSKSSSNVELDLTVPDSVPPVAEIGVFDPVRAVCSSPVSPITLNHFLKATYNAFYSPMRFVIIPWQNI